jgi:hypothetical protein
MSIEGDMDYALTRVQARHGRRLDEAGWRRLEASRNVAQYLDAVRASSLASWISALGPTHDCHAIERALRIEWRHYVENLAGWHPREFQAWLAWCAWLPSLSLLAELATPYPMPQWMLADPVCGPVALGSPAERAVAVMHTALAPLAPAIARRVPIGPLWRAHWQRLQPQWDAHTNEVVRRFLRTIEAHFNELRGNTGSALILRMELAQRLERLFRASANTVVTTVCHLALLALELERLRGGLASRAVI